MSSQQFQSDNTDGWGALLKLLISLQVGNKSHLRQHLTAPPEQQRALLSGLIARGASLKLFNEKEVVAKVANAMGMNVADLAKSDLADPVVAISDDILQKVPLEHWREFRAVPLARNRGKLVVAFANPLSVQTKQEIEFALGESVESTVALESEILALLNRKLSRMQGSTSEGNSSTAQDSTLESSIDTSDVDAAPVVKIVNKIFMDAFERGASDIHISPEKRQISVRVRTDGVLVDLMQVPANLAAGVLSRIKLLAGMDISERRRPQDGRLRIQSGGENRDLRVSSVPSLYGENIVARVLNSNAALLTLDSLEMPTTTRNRFEGDLTGSSQVILVTGPTGSGKTSSLYAAISFLKDGSSNIVTIEDPIEYRLQGITQIQVNTKIGMTFAEALRSVLRQDPDVVVVGEIRDSETATIAMQTAQTGHVVLATLHTNSAASAITRLHDLKIPTYLISSSVRGVLAQRLVRKICGDCACDESKIALCKPCSGTGYRGRVGVYSYLHLSDETREAIRNEVSEQELETLARKYGFQSLNEAALALVDAKITTEAEVVRVLGSSPSQNEQHVRNSQDQLNSASLKETGLSKISNPVKKKILLVEDDENIRIVLRMLLERAMYDVVHVSDGRQALEQVYAEKPDLIICDLMMPHMDGTETVQILRRNEATRSIPILMLTAADSEENEVALIQAGADDFVSKGADHKVLLSRVSRLVQR